MMSPIIVAEGIADAEVIQWALRADLAAAGARVMPAHGISAAESLARSLLARNHDWIALVCDADASNANEAMGRREYLESALGSVAPNGHFLVSMFFPEFETVFFYDPSVIELVVGRALDPVERERASFAPKRVLYDLLQRELGAGQQPRATLMRKLGSIAPGAVRSHPEMGRLISFLAASRSG